MQKVRVIKLRYALSQKKKLFAVETELADFRW